MGHEVTIASNSYGDVCTPRDIYLKRGKGKIGGLLHYISLKYLLHTRLKGYDIVAINDPHFTALQPSLLKNLFDRLRKENGSLFYTAMSTDIFFLKMLEDKNSPLRYSEWFINGNPSPWYINNTDRWNNWHNTELQDYQKHFFKNIDGAVAVLYEYYKGLEYALPTHKISYGGIPIVTESIPVKPVGENNKIKILLCRDSNRRLLKGSDILLNGAERILRKYPDKVELNIAENLPYNIFIEELGRNDIILDQVYSYTPATTALLAMAMGKTVISGGESDYYRFINEHSNFPIINASLDIDSLSRQIDQLVTNPGLIGENGRKSIDFVKKHNDSHVVARRFLSFWVSKLK